MFSRLLTLRVLTRALFAQVERLVNTISCERLVLNTHKHKHTPPPPQPYSHNAFFIKEIAGESQGSWWSGQEARSEGKDGVLATLPVGA